MSKLKHTLTKLLWQQAWPRLLRPLQFFFRLFYALSADLIKGDINLRAMSLVYTLLLSFVPLLAFSFSLLKAFGVHNQMQPLLHKFLEPLGNRSAEMTSQIIGFVNNIDVRLLGTIGLGLLLFSVIRLMHKIQKSLDFTWELDAIPGIGKRMADYISLLMVGPLLVFALISAASAVGELSLIQRLLEYRLAAGVFESLIEWLPFLILTTGLAFIYWFLPNTRVYWYTAFIGGLVAAVLWKSMGVIFARFVVSSAQYQVYSAFASVLLFMIWIYLTWLIFLLGSRISFYLQNPQQMAISEQSKLSSMGYVERSVLSVFALIGRRYTQKKPPLSATAIARELHIPILDVNRILQLAEESRYLASTNDSVPAWLPAVSFSELRVTDVFSMLKGSAPQTIITTPEIDALMLSIDQSIDNELGAYTIDQL